MHRFGVIAAAVVVLTVQGCFKSGDDTEKTAAVSSVQASSVSSLSSLSSNANEAAAVRLVALSVGLDELPEGNATNAEITATYNDGKTKKMPFGFQWKIGNPNVVTADGTRLTAKAEGTTTVQAVVNGKCSPARRITVYKLIHGHRLPPEPDPQVNNATLLGIDSNHNDVRDDVERWIYENHMDAHPVHIDIAMQPAKAYMQILAAPEQAKEIDPKVSAFIACETYYMVYAKYFNQPILVEERIDDKVFAKILKGTSENSPNPRETNAWIK
jgi:hypothetical protein